jgi:aspartate/tyrosine/aromatic aminotransferase
MLDQLPPQAPDALLAVMSAFAADTSPDKVDLGVGVYKDALGATPVMAAVKAAEARLIAAQRSKVYVGPAGNRAFAAFMERLVLGEGHPALASGRVVTLQTPGGCGALRLVADLIVRTGTTRDILIGDPTWANHHALLTSAGLTAHRMPYFDVRSGELCFAAMLEALEAATEGTVVLLQGACHNPTGADLSAAQWQTVAEVLERRRLVPLVDMAYQGLGNGLDEDAAGLRLLAERLPEVLLAVSCSKNFGLYRERVGAVLVVARSAAVAATSFAHLQTLARRIYSMPPDHGAAIVATIAADPALLEAWQAELTVMRTRVNGLRRLLADALAAAYGDDRHEAIADQRGMFSILGSLTPEAVTRLAREEHVYVAPDGRINLAGLPETAVGRVAAAVRRVAP